MDSKHFSTLINDFKPGIFGALNEKKEELLKEGRKVYNLSVGTPDFEPPLHVMKAMEEACKDPNNYKYSLADMPELLEAVQYRYEKRFGVHVERMRLCLFTVLRKQWLISVWYFVIRTM